MAILVHRFLGEILFCQNPFSAIFRQKKSSLATKPLRLSGWASKKNFFAASLSHITSVTKAFSNENIHSSYTSFGKKCSLGHRPGMRIRIRLGPIFLLRVVFESRFWSQGLDPDPVNLNPNICLSGSKIRYGS